MDLAGELSPAVAAPTADLLWLQDKSLATHYF